MRWTSRVALVVAVSLTSVSTPAPAQETDVIARCGAAVVRRVDLDKVVRRLGLAATADEPQRQRAEAAILEQLVDERILRAELERQGIRATGAEVEAALARLREQVAARGLEFESFLAASGRTPGDLDAQVALEIALEKFVRPQMTAAAIAETFERNRRELDGTRLRVSHIVLRPEAGGSDDVAAGLLERAAAIRQQVVQGRLSFAEAARLHSAGPSRREGGDLGWIGREGPMAEGFSRRAYGLSKGSVSPPFSSPQGVHIVTVTAVEPGRIGIDAVRPRLEKILAQDLVRGLVVAGRSRSPVSFAAGVPHFDPATADQSLDQRPLIVRTGAED
jgi:parvulin-like peptidyl-prolyl isomerase